MAQTTTLDPRMARAAAEAFEQLRFVVLEALAELGSASALDLASELSIPLSVVGAIFSLESRDGNLIETDQAGVYQFANCDGE